MPQHDDMRQIRQANLRLATAVAEIEGLYTALLRTRSSQRRRGLRADLAAASRRLAALADLLPGARPATGVVPRSRWQRRRALAERGAAWIMARYGGEGD